MPSIMKTHLEAMLIDQIAAGMFAGKRYAFTPVMNDNGWGLGVAVHNERGYHAIGNKTFDYRPAAELWANDLNRHIGLREYEAEEIIISGMRG